MAAAHTAMCMAISSSLNRSGSSMHRRHLAQSFLEAGHLVVGHPDGGKPDVAGLDHAPSLEQLDEGDAVLGEHEIEMGDQLARLERRDVGAVALADVDHAHQRQCPERLAQDGPADLHHLGEVALGRELVAGSQLLCPDLVEQPVGDLLGQRAP